MHDSQGFVAGEVHNYRRVEEFIEDRAKQPILRDQLHAIWCIVLIQPCGIISDSRCRFCAEIPITNSALFEIADENFLNLSDLHSGIMTFSSLFRLRSSLIWITVPVVVVFTKFDLLVRKLEEMADDDVDEKELQRLIHMRAEEIFQETCVQKLKFMTRHRTTPIAYVKVSSMVQLLKEILQRSLCLYQRCQITRILLKIWYKRPRVAWTAILVSYGHLLSAPV